MYYQHCRVFFQTVTASATVQPTGDYLFNHTLNHYTSTISVRLNNFINIASSQDTSINSLLTTLPSFLQSSIAASTYQPIGSYLTTSSANLIYQDLPWVAGQVSMHPITGATILIQVGKTVLQLQGIQRVIQ